MSDPTMNENSGRGNLFPIVIAVTALVLSVTSGVVNYRQNNLANLESSLRDTRDQLQLAKNDITDIKVKTIKQLVDAELAVKNQQRFKDENSRLKEALNDAQVRLSELEAQIKRMDHQLVSAKAALKSAKRHAAAKQSPARSKPKQVVAKAAGKAELAQLIARADLDIYTQRIAPSLQQSIGSAIANAGFKPKFPPRPSTMGLSRATTIYYYDASYKAVAERLVQSLVSITRGKVSIRKGASPYPANKIIVHVIGN